MNSTGPKPRVEYDGNTYVAKSYNVEIPDFSEMSRIEALVWLNKNTYKRGHSTKPPAPNLAGLTLVVR